MTLRSPTPKATVRKSDRAVAFTGGTRKRKEGKGGERGGISQGAERGVNVALSTHPFTAPFMHATPPKGTLGESMTRETPLPLPRGRVSSVAAPTIFFSLARMQKKVSDFPLLWTAMQKKEFLVHVVFFSSMLHLLLLTKALPFFTTPLLPSNWDKITQTSILTYVWERDVLTLKKLILWNPRWSLRFSWTWI